MVLGPAPRVQRFHRLLLDETASTAIEYAILASLIAVAIVATVTLLGSNVGGLYSKIVQALK